MPNKAKAVVYTRPISVRRIIGISTEDRMLNKAKTKSYAYPARSRNSVELIGGRFPAGLASWRGTRAGPPEG